MELDPEVLRHVPLPVFLHLADVPGHEVEQRRHARLKRPFDFCFSLLALLTTAPLIGMIAIALKASDPSAPAFFAQTRVGRGGREFRVWKLRTMHADAEGRLAELLRHRPDLRQEFEATQKLSVDPRVTRLGRLLRTSSLDELPQFLNVLRGDMSVVGPRPIVPDEVRRYRAHADDYFSVRPGVTGPWQASGRNQLTYETRVALDASYARFHTLRGDLRLVARTIATVLRRSGQ